MYVPVLLKVENIMGKLIIGLFFPLAITLSVLKIVHNTKKMNIIKQL
jgi:hypothetical protein